MWMCSRYRLLCRAGRSNHMSWPLQSTTIKCCPAQERGGISGVLTPDLLGQTWFLQSPYRLQSDMPASLPASNSMAKASGVTDLLTCSDVSAASPLVTWPLTESRTWIPDTLWKPRQAAKPLCTCPANREGAPLNYPLFTWLGKKHLFLFSRTDSQSLVCGRNKDKYHPLNFKSKC